MGSGTSRGKKVAPACVIREVRMNKGGGAGVHPSQKGRGPCSRHKVQPESRSEGPHSDNDTDGPSARKTSPRRTFIRPKTYALCPFSGGDTEDEASCSPRVPRSVPRDQNKSDCVFTPRKQPALADFTQRHPSTQMLSAGGTFLEIVPTCDKQRPSGGSSLPMPLILYDGSEEELMDTIEREFN